MSYVPEIVDSIITKNNINANERIYDELADMITSKIDMKRVEIAQNMFPEYEEAE